MSTNGRDGTSSRSRTTHAEAILGPELHARLKDTKVLLVGAGGIGCELLKNIVMTGFGRITLLDLDTIDLSNLNRQFLFRKKDIKQSKALVAAHAASAFNPNVKILPIHANIKEPQFDVEWFKQFDIVLNALDNLDARRHVNKMCIAADVPLVESGTAGYLGQVQPLLKDKTECFDCIPKPTPKTFPVCTIRSTPSQPIHCIVWSKSYLMGQLFGEDEDATGELDEAEKQGENEQEIANLRKEAQAFKSVRDALRSSTQSSDAAKLVFQKVFNSDIKNLLSMSDMWRARAPPQPLDFDSIMDGSFLLTKKVALTNSGAPGANTKSNGMPIASGSGTGGSSSNPNLVNGNGNGNPATATTSSSTSTSATATSVLKDQKKLTLLDNLKLFVSSTERLAKRLQSGKEEIIGFDKDDDDTLDFVTASANLRSAAYGIEGKTRWEVKEMAGNIIPAIATTNATISGLIVLQALHILRKSYHKLRNVHIQFKPTVPLSGIRLSNPNPNCGICRDVYVGLPCDPARVRLGEAVNAVLGACFADGEEVGEVSVYEDKRILSDPDFDDNNERTLESLSVTRGKFLSIVDEDGRWATISVAICMLPPNYSIDAPPYILPSSLPRPPKKTPAPVAEPPETPPKSLKRPAPSDDDVVELSGPAAKKPRQTVGMESGVPASPSKKRRLEEDGLVMMDSVDDRLDDDVIEID